MLAHVSAVNLDPYYGGTDVASHAHAGGQMPHATWQTQTTNHPNCLRTYLHTLLPIPLPCPTELVPSSEAPSGPRRLLATYLRINSRGTLLTSGENLSAHHLSLAGASGGFLLSPHVPAHDCGGIICPCPHAIWSKSQIRTYVRT